MTDQAPGTEGTPRDPAWDLLPAYALDAVDDLERRSVERLVDSDEDARRALAEYRAVASALVPDVEPPAGVRSAVFDRIAESDDVDVDADVVPIGRARRRWPLVAVAAAALVAIAVPTTIAVDQHRDRVQLQKQADAVAAILADPNAKLVASTVPGGGLTTALVAGDRALFSATNMPAAPSGKTYQLWVVADGVATSAGLMGEGATRVVVDASAGDTLAVTIEPSGGSKQPTTTPIVSLAT